MKYQYTLTAYNKNGKEKEVQEEELPNDVKTAINVE